MNNITPFEITKIPVQKEYKIIKDNILFSNVLEKELNEAIRAGYKIERIDIIGEQYIVWIYRLIEKAPQEPTEIIEK